MNWILPRKIGVERFPEIKYHVSKQNSGNFAVLANIYKGMKTSVTIAPFRAKTV